MTKSQAIKEARAEVGALYKFGDGYKFNSWDASVSAYRESDSHPFHQAHNHRRQVLRNKAESKLGKEPTPLPFEGSWHDDL